MAQVDVTPESTESEEELANKAALDRANRGILEGDQTGDESTPDKSATPEWCPEKYARFNEDGTFNASLAAQEMAKGMEHLNKMATQKSQGVDTDDDVLEDDLTETDSAPEGDEGPLTTPELWQSFTDEYAANGELSAESRNIIRDLGIPDQMVDDYIAGQQARGSNYKADVTSVLGENGSAEYDALVDWADDNMTEAEAEVFNAAVGSGDTIQAKMAIRDLKAKYVAAEGDYTDLPLGGGGGGAGGGGTAQPFPSRAQMSDAINDPRYAKDPAFRKAVEDRIAVTNL